MFFFLNKEQVSNVYIYKVVRFHDKILGVNGHLYLLI